MGIKFEAKSRVWKITLSVLIVFIIFLVLWLLIGDIDLLDKDYIVAKNGILWSGTVTSHNIDWLFSHYAKYGITYQTLTEDIGHRITINSSSLIFNPIIIYWMLGASALSILMPIIGRLCKFNNWDMASYTYAIMMGCWCFILTAMIPYFNSDKKSWLPSLWWLLRIFLLVIAAGIGFLIFNAIFGVVMTRSRYSNQYINELRSNKKAEDIARQESKDTIDSYLKSKSKDDITYIEKDKNKS